MEYGGAGRVLFYRMSCVHIRPDRGRFRAQSVKLLRKRRLGVSTEQPCNCHREDGVVRASGGGTARSRENSCPNISQGLLVPGKNADYVSEQNRKRLWRSEETKEAR